MTGASRAAAASLLVLGGALGVPWSPAQAAASTEPPACDPSAGVEILLLFDVSGSLRTTDPDATRRDGGIASLSDLRRLQREYEGIEFSIAVDSFASEYDVGTWVNLSTASEQQRRLLDQRVRAVGNRSDGGHTDYREALNGAFRRFAGLSPLSCKRMIWFTDGGHDTEPRTSSEFTAAESAEIDGLCLPSGAAGALTSAGVWVSAVHLSHGVSSGVAEPLRRLFGESHLPCAASLIGEIVDIPDVSGLAALLSERIEDDSFEAVEQPPRSEPCDVVEAGDGRNTCVYSFVLPAGTEAFDTYLDLKSVPNPTALDIFLRPPSGNDLIEMEFPDERAVEPDTGFMIFAGTSNWYHLSGHQAAEHAAARSGDRAWEWEGEWGLVFRGSGHQLSRVTPPRLATLSLPTLAVTYSEDGDRVDGYVRDEAQPDFVGAVVFSVDAPQESQHGQRVGSADGYTVVEGSWQIIGLGESISEDATVESLLFRNNGTIKVRAQLAKIVRWGDETLRWTVPGAEQIIFIATDGAGDGRSCRTLDFESGTAECSFRFALGQRDASFRITTGIEGIPGAHEIHVSMRSPSGESRHALDFTHQQGDLNTAGFLAHTGSASRWVVEGHQAISTMGYGYADTWEWAGDWQIIFRGGFEQISAIPAPRISTRALPMLAAHYDPSEDRIDGQVSNPGGGIIYGHVALSVEAPDAGQHELVVGDIDGYVIEPNGRWEAIGIIDALLDVPGMRSLLRQHSGSVSIAAQPYVLVDWGDNEDIPWPVPMSRFVMTVDVPRAAGWDSAYVHPWVTEIAPSETPYLTPTGQFRATVRTGTERGTLRLARVTFTSSTDAQTFAYEPDAECVPELAIGAGADCLPNWSCLVPQGAEEATCDVIEVPLTVSSDTVGTIAFDFVSSLDEEEELLAAGIEQGLGEEATHLYRAARQVQTAQVEMRVAETSGRVLYFILFFVALLAVSTAMRLLGSRRR